MGWVEVQLGLADMVSPQRRAKDSARAEMMGRLQDGAGEAKRVER